MFICGLLWLHGFGFSASASWFRLRSFGFAASSLRFHFKYLAFVCAGQPSQLRLHSFGFAAWASASASRRHLWLHGFGFVIFIFVIFSSRLGLSGFGLVALASRMRLGKLSETLVRLSLLLSLLASVVLVFSFMIAALRVHVAASASRLQFHVFGFAASASQREFRGFAFAPSASACWLSLRSFNFTTSSSILHFKVLASRSRLRKPFLSTSASQRFTASTSRLSLFGRSLSSRLRLCGFGIAALIFLFRLRGSRFRFFQLWLRVSRLWVSPSASWFRLRGFSFESSALRFRPLRLRGVGFAFSGSRWL